MQAGALRALLLIEAPTESLSARGGVQTSWATFVSAWGELVPLRPQEVEAAKQRWAQVSHKVTVRFRPDLTNKMRLTYTLPGETARMFDIRGFLDPDGRRRQLDLYCMEHQA